MFFVLSVAASLMLLYLFGTRNLNYWKKKNVVHDKPVPFFGNVSRQLFLQINNTNLYAEKYNRYPEEKYVGLYEGNKVSIILRDPELVKIVLQRDFSTFYARGFKGHKDCNETLMRNMFSADGDLWKMLRQEMTSIFSGRKLKAMFPIIVEKAEKLQNMLSEFGPDDNEINFKDVMARYTTDTIGACGFGVDTCAFTDETSLFLNMGKRFLTVKPRDVLVFLLKLISPRTFKNLKTFPPELESSMLMIMRFVMEQRKYSPSVRNDFVDYLLELKTKGKVLIESMEKKNIDGSPAMIELDLDEITMAAQMFSFFVGGFETSSSASSSTLHQLAFYPEIQKKCQDEIDKVLEKHDNELCYDAIKDMVYLEMCVKEAMRLIPPVGYVTRLNAKKYTFPGTNLTIDEDVTIIIPIQALHLDSKYFDEPDEFRPERFHRDNVKDIKPCTYLPFGGGPRTCIASRLGMMQTMAGLVAVLSKYSVKPSKNSVKIPPRDPTSNFVQTIKGGLPLLLVARQY